MTSDEIKRKYDTVGGILEQATNKAEAIELVGKEENAELDVIKTTLRGISNEFKQEIAKLEASSEWDKFCMAFLGETNAGKSTIIESLRIIYDEEQRRLEKEWQKNEYEKVLTDHAGRYNDLVNTLKQLNDMIVTKNDSSKVAAVLRIIAFITIGFCVGADIGFVIAFFSL